MKGIKTILGALAVAGLLCFSFSASAQENGNRDENGNVVRGPYETNNGLFDNTFIGAAVGYNTAFRDIVKYDDGKGGLAVDVNLGKWITPTVGLRIGWKGINNANDENDFGDFKQNYIHADVLWNISNAFSGYKETRFWDIAPYLTTGGLAVKPDGEDTDWEYAAGVGILNMFRLSDRVDLTIDLTALMAKESQYHYFSEGRFYYPVSATIGLSINMGRTNWDRHTSITPVVIPTAHSDAEYNALQKKYNDLLAENKALRDEIEALKNQKPDVVYVNKGSDVVAASRTYFDLGSSRISAREKAHLDFFIKNVINNSDSDKVFDVIGSADSATGSAATNERLSLARAKAVADYLVKNGVPESKLNVKGIGGVDDYKPANLNRAVEIK